MMKLNTTFFYYERQSIIFQIAHGVPQDAIMMVNLYHKIVLIPAVSVDIHSNGKQGVCAVSSTDDSEQHGKRLVKFVTVYAI